MSVVRDSFAGWHLVLLAVGMVGGACAGSGEVSVGGSPDVGTEGGAADVGAPGGLPDVGGASGSPDVGSEAGFPDAGPTSCVPEDDAAFCSRAGRPCDEVTAEDNCGGPRTVDCTCPLAGLRVPFASRGVDLEGDLSEFEVAEPVQVALASAAATFRLLWDSGFLYLAATVSDSDLRFDGSGEDGPLNQGDSVEVLLDPQHTRAASPDGTYRHVILSAHGDKLDASGAAGHNDPTFDMAGLAWHVASAGTFNDASPDVGYRVVVKIPWAELPLAIGQSPGPGLAFSADLGLNDLDAAGLTYGDWAQLADWGQSAQWKDAVLVGWTGSCAEDDRAFCSRLGKNCGAVTALDNCGAPRTTTCGSCTGPQTCGGGGVEDVCGASSLPDGGCSPQGPDAGAPPPSTLPVTLHSAPAITDRQYSATGMPPTAGATSLSLAAAPGEFEPVRFLVHANADVSAVQLTASPLTSPCLPEIPAHAVDIRVLKKWYQFGKRYWWPERDPNTGALARWLVSELLVKDDTLIKIDAGTQDNYVKLPTGYVWISDGSNPDTAELPNSCTQKPADLPVQDSAALLPVDLAAGENKDFVVTVHVPEGTPAGDYAGRIDLAAADGRTAALGVQLRVLPFQLAPSILTYSIYYRGYLDPARPQGSLCSFHKNEAQALSDLRGMVNHGISNPTVDQWLDGGAAADTLLRLRVQAGITAKELFWSGYAVGYEWDTPDGIRANVTAARNAVLGVAAYGGLTDLYVNADERPGGDFQRSCYQAVHDAGGKVYAASASNISYLMDLVEILNWANEPDAGVAAQWHAGGRRVFNYQNPQVGVESPETYRRNYGLFLWQRDFDGAMDFAYQWVMGKSAWNDFDNTFVRDFMFTYPTVDGSIDTIEYEGFREGVDDVRYLSTLLRRIDERRAQGADVTAAQAFVSALKVDPLTDLDAVRASIVQQILALQ